MRGSAAKDFRRQAEKAANRAIETMARPIADSMHNEKLTRERVGKLETKVEARYQRDALRLAWLESLSRRGLRGRLRWLLTGR